ncbi:hypothetical protein C5S36_08730 [Candidatus Methanophagaceae archaeon]|jgi:hypothetical protein|nr:hypothetical protein C5S36_08730 [Methanophagales archaeon]
MSEARPKPNIKIVKDVGYRVIMKNEDGTPRQVLRGFVKEGDYGKFIAVEAHWVQKMDGEKIVDSQWARKSYTFPDDQGRAHEKWNYVKELLDIALDVSAGGNLEEEVEEEFSDELEGLEDDF